jgi:hypothetical protein
MSGLRLSGLGQATGQFSEEALFALQSELQQVRAEADAVEAEITAIQTGRPVPRQAEPGVKARVNAAFSYQLPGGTVNLPVVGEVPVLAIGAGVLLLLKMRKK